MITGAFGAVVLADTRRLDECSPAVDYFEAGGLPFIAGVNGFDGEATHSVADVQDALTISLSVPVVECDARERSRSGPSWCRWSRTRYGAGRPG